MYDFHKYTKADDKQNGLVINRPGFLETVSITQVIVADQTAKLVHDDLIRSQEFTHTFNFL